MLQNEFALPRIIAGRFEGDIKSTRGITTYDKRTKIILHHTLRQNERRNRTVAASLSQPIDQLASPILPAAAASIRH
jgi:hypothetical protein